jgi:hypothetical protein
VRDEVAAPDASTVGGVHDDGRRAFVVYEVITRDICISGRRYATGEVVLDQNDVIAAVCSGEIM